MEEKLSRSEKGAKPTVGRDKVKTFFIGHLNRVYCAKVHLTERLQEILGEAHYTDLQAAIKDTILTVENQIARMDEIYILLDAIQSDKGCNGLVALVQEAFEDIKQHNGDMELRDMAILFYLQNIESLEMASFQILQMAAVKLKIKQVEKLLKENYEEAKADRMLLLLISAKYIAS